ncbi:MAG: DnaJ domain-containing protein [Myxococcales bacterium]|nr:DnaJ domain-containing protein [Myxococcales bacterium]
MKTKKPPPIGTRVRISLTLPSGSTVELSGTISALVAEGELEGRGPGIDIGLSTLPQSVMWLIESALSSAGITPRPLPDHKETLSTPPPPSKEESEEESLDLLDSDELVSAEGDLVKALWQELGGMSKMNAFQLLGLSYEATDQEVRAAFGALSKKYHPDRFTRYESVEIGELANEVFILFRDAYRNLSTETGRRDVLVNVEAQRAAGVSAMPQTPQPPPTPAAARGMAVPPPTPPRRPSTPPPPTPARSTTAPPQPRPQANAPESTQSYGNADGSSPASLTPSTPISGLSTPATGNDGSSRVSMGMKVLESGQYEQALRILRVEARKDPNNVMARAGVELAEGRLALVSGDRMEAAERFEAALDIDPSNERAAREIADMRRHATSQRRGLLSKLMKKV